MLPDTSRTKRPDTKPREEREDGMETIAPTDDEEDIEMRQLENAMNQNETLGRHRRALPSSTRQLRYTLGAGSD